MAVAAKLIPITREHVYQWREAYDGELPLRDYLVGKIAEMNLVDEYLDVNFRDDWIGEAVHVVDVILEDLPSYGWTTDAEKIEFRDPD